MRAMSTGRDAIRAPRRGALTQSRSASSAMCSAIAMLEVAPGEGAFRTETTGPSRLMRKSSTSDPSGSSACARTPAGAGTRSSAEIAGT